MIDTIKKRDKTYYSCKECGLVYLDKEIAKKCGAWCKKYKTCNLEFIKKAVKP